MLIIRHYFYCLQVIAENGVEIEDCMWSHSDLSNWVDFNINKVRHSTSSSVDFISLHYFPSIQMLLLLKFIYALLDCYYPIVILLLSKNLNSHHFIEYYYFYSTNSVLIFLKFRPNFNSKLLF